MHALALGATAAKTRVKRCTELGRCMHERSVRSVLRQKQATGMHSPDRHVALRCSFGELQRSMWCAHRGKRAQAHKLAFVLAINLQPAPALSFQGWQAKHCTADRPHAAHGKRHCTQTARAESTHNALEDAVVQVDDQGAAASRPLWRAGAGGLGRGALLLAQGCGGGGRGRATLVGVGARRPRQQHPHARAPPAARAPKSGQGSKGGRVRVACSQGQHDPDCCMGPPQSALICNVRACSVCVRKFIAAASGISHASSAAGAPQTGAAVRARGWRRGRSAAPRAWAARPQSRR